MISHPTVEQLHKQVRYLAGCCLHDDAAKRADDAESVEMAACSCDFDETYRDNGGETCRGPPCEMTENEELWLFRLKDGRYGVLEESEDYSGHG